MRFPRYPVLLQRRHENGKPSASLGRKATGPSGGSRATESRSKPRSVGSVVRGAPWIPFGGSASDEKDLMGWWERCCSLFALRPGTGSRRCQAGTYPSRWPKGPPRDGEGRVWICPASRQGSHRNDPMLTPTTQPPTEHLAKRHGAHRASTNVVLENGVSRNARSLHLLRGLPPPNSRPFHSHLGVNCDDGTMKGPTGPGCFGGGVSMVRPARVGICAASRMEEWTQRSLWGQHHGPESQEKEMCARSRNGDSADVAAPRAGGSCRWPNRRGESIAP